MYSYPHLNGCLNPGHYTSALKGSLKAKGIHAGCKHSAHVAHRMSGHSLLYHSERDDVCLQAQDSLLDYWKDQADG